MYLAAHFFMIFGALFVFAIILIGILALGVILLTIGLISRHLNKKKGLKKKYPKVCIIIGGIFMAISLGTFGVFAIDFLDDSGNEYNPATYDPYTSTYTQDEKYSKEMMKEVIRCLDENDTDGLKSMFSEYAAESSDLDSQIEEAMKIYEGKSVSYGSLGCERVSSHVAYGYHHYMYVKCDAEKVITDADNEYYIEIYIVLANDKKPESEGIKIVKIMDPNNKKETLIQIGCKYIM